MLNIVAVSGSLQKASCNTGLLRTLVAHNHKLINIDVVSIADFPLFSEDIEKVGVPEAVKKVADKVRAADGIIFAIPEYNASVSSPLKNAYDWLSRGGDKAAVYQKPVAFVSAGLNGGSAAQTQMKDVIQYCKLKLMENPKVQIPRFQPGNFGEDGSLINKSLADDLLLFLDAFAAFVKKNKA